jgi:hypothetical protein
MGFLDRLLGRPERPSTPQQNRWGQPSEQGYRYGQQSYQVPGGATSGGPSTSGGPDGWGSTPTASERPRTEDEQAVERYRYLLRTAPPERIEEVHAEAFERLTPEQRRMVYDEFTRTAPAGEAPRGDDPRSLAQAATRSEIRQPGYVERSLGGMRGGAGGAFGGGRSGPGFGSMLGASILGTVAGYVIGSTLMSAFLPDAGGLDGGTDASGDGSGDGSDGGSGDGSDGGDAGGDAQAADWGGSDSGDGGFGDGGGFGDFGGGFGDFGGDFDV